MRFRKKPVEVEAREFHDDASAYEIAEWCGGVVLVHGPAHRKRIQIHTMEGEMNASPGDWIIKGVQGEFYPCKPGIFALTYEAVEGTSEPERDRTGAEARRAARRRTLRRQRP